MGLLKVNPYAKHLTEQESIALVKMLAKRESYVRQGRANDAHGAGTAILILWDCLLDFADTTPSGWEEL